MRKLTLFLLLISTPCYAGYFAEIDSTKIVKRVIVADKSFIDSGAVGDPSSWAETKEDNYAGKGYKYDDVNNIFVSPQPYPSWEFDKQTKEWKSKVAKPSKKQGEIVVWNESQQKWDTLNEASK